MTDLTTLLERSTALWYAGSSHEWILRYVHRMRRLRPDLPGRDMLELAVDAHGMASALLPEQAAALTALERA